MYHYYIIFAVPNFYILEYHEQFSEELCNKCAIVCKGPDYSSNPAPYRCNLSTINAQDGNMCKKL